MIGIAIFLHFRTVIADEIEDSPAAYLINTSFSTNESMLTTFSTNNEILQHFGAGLGFCSSPVSFADSLCDAFDGGTQSVDRASIPWPPALKLSSTDGECR